MHPTVSNSIIFTAPAREHQT